jgi:hypothetical protein
MPQAMPGHNSAIVDFQSKRGDSSAAFLLPFLERSTRGRDKEDPQETTARQSIRQRRLLPARAPLDGIVGIWCHGSVGTFLSYCLEWFGRYVVTTPLFADRHQQSKIG